MVSKAWLRMMARYNRWQNDALYGAADTLDDTARRLDRGAFWLSIHGTFSHILWADRQWMSRFGAADPPGVPQAASPTFVSDWADLQAQRRALDDRIVDWADSFAEDGFAGTLKWFSGALGRDTQAPLGVVIPHMFNHQTHHRGQAHAMITAAGARTQDTDLFAMPPDRWPT
jgi:uncharacterized damage-inducible protein DinB